MKDISFFDKQKIAVIPVLPASKAPVVKGWTNRCVEDNDPAEHDDDSNIGVVLGKNSNGIVDIDLDTPAAVQLVPYFLPETGWKFGRETARNSHWIYRVNGNPGDRVQIKLCDEMFAEYRANGCMTP